MFFSLLIIFSSMHCIVLRRFHWSESLARPRTVTLLVLTLYIIYGGRLPISHGSSIPHRTYVPHQLCRRKQVVKQRRNPVPHRKTSQNLTKGKRSTSERRATPFTYTKCWSKCTRTLEFLVRPCRLWIPLLTIFLSVLRPRRLVWRIITRGRLSRRGRCKLPSASCCPASSLNTPSARELKPSLNTLAPSNFYLLYV